MAAPPDLIILDYQMLVRNAYELVEILKQDAACRDIPTLAADARYCPAIQCRSL